MGCGGTGDTRARDTLPRHSLSLLALPREMVECFNKIAQDPDCRAVVISGAGKMFSAGTGYSPPPPLPVSRVPGNSAMLLN